MGDCHERGRLTRRQGEFAIFDLIGAHRAPVDRERDFTWFSPDGKPAGLWPQVYLDRGRLLVVHCHALLPRFVVGVSDFDGVRSHLKASNVERRVWDHVPGPDGLAVNHHLWRLSG